MVELLHIYRRILAARIRAQMQYRASLLLQMLAAFCLSFTDLFVVLVIFQHLPALAGWTLGEVAFLYGTSYVAFQLTDMAVGHLDQLPQKILTGEFDLILIRPLGTLFQVITSEFTLRRVGSLLQGILALGIALSLVDIRWTPLRLLVFVTMPLSGLCIFAGVWIVGATSSFWLVRSMEAVNAFTYGGNMLASYPMQIYGDWLRRLFTYVLPLAFVNFFPSLYVLDKPDPIGAAPFVRFLSPLVAVAVLLASRAFWTFGVRRYRSTGS